MLEFFTSFLRRPSKLDLVEGFYESGLFHRVPISWFRDFNQLGGLPSDSHVHVVYSEALIKDLADLFNFGCSIRDCVHDGFPGWDCIPETDVYAKRVPDGIVLGLDELNKKTFPLWEQLLRAVVEHNGCQDCKRVLSQNT